jgi:hypothetical protein
MIKNRILALALSTVALVAACEQEQTTNPDTATQAAAFAGDVALDVTVSGVLPQEAAQRFADVGAEGKIRSLATERLRASGKWDDGLSVTVDVQEFRLRTTAQVAWVGAMAGADYIAATVSVRRDGQVIKQEKISSTSIRGGMVGAKEQKRLDHVVDDFANRIAALL